MATVTGLTAARMLEIEDASVVSGEINGSGHLILTTFGGDEIDAGPVLGTIPDASETVKGIVELATTAEAEAGSDTTRAVTPAGLATAISSGIPDASETVKGKIEIATAAEADAGTDTTRALTPAHLARIITPTAEADPSTAYPLGTSLFSITTGSGWSLNGGVGMVLTHNVSTARCHQTFHINGGTGIVPRRFARGYNSGSGGWSSWYEMYMGPTQILGLVYPVGSIYISTVSTNPATLLGIGTWSAIQGRFLIGADGTYTAGSTGGNANKTLSTGEMPSHTHSDGTLATGGGGTHTHSIGRDQDGATGSVERVLHSSGISGAEQVFSGQLTSDGDHTHDVTGSTGSAGSGTAFSILPPYLAVYMWQRTA